MAFELTEQVQRHLDNDAVMFLTTVTPSGRPVPKPIWFLWDGSGIVFFSQPKAAKLRHIPVNPQVSLSTDVNERGEDFVTIGGTAAVVPDGPSGLDIPAYRDRYAEESRKIGMTLEQLSAEFSVHIRITPTHLWAIP